MRLHVDLPMESWRDCFRRGRWRDFALRLIPPPNSRITSTLAKVDIFNVIASISHEMLRLLLRTRITFHTSRHTCATLLCHQGVPITTVQKILGHTSVSTTQIYQDVMRDTIVCDLRRIDGRNAAAPDV